jgi:hypothetical protein
MEPSGKSRSPLIMAGMHRSGTSLGASLLESAGLDVGERLMEGNWSNPRGHYEDLDFVELHKDALKVLGLDPDGWVLTELPELPGDVVDRARLLVEQRQASGRAWGFKDPRATLFLRMWAEICPEARFLFVHRVPWEVVDSLYRRGDAVFSTDPELAIQAWLYYNRAILDFSNHAPARCSFVNVETIAEYPVEWVAAVAKHAGIALGPPSPSIYEAGLLHGSLARARASVIVEHFPDAIRLFGALEARAWRPAGAPAVPFRSGATPETERRLALEDWHQICVVSGERDKLREELGARANEREAPPADGNGAAAPGDGLT